MLKKFFTFIILFLMVLRPVSAMDVRLKALGAMALYGTVGGALLGTASLAFGGEGRNVAKGASLGLYGGLIFGTYVVVSHAYRKHERENPKPQENYYPGVQSPYEQDPNGGAYDDEAGGGFRWQPVQELQQQAARELESDMDWSLRGRQNSVMFFLPLYNTTF